MLCVVFPPFVDAGFWHALQVRRLNPIWSFVTASILQSWLLFGDYFFLLIYDWNSAFRHACSQDAQTHPQLYGQYHNMTNSYHGEELSQNTIDDTIWHSPTWQTTAVHACGLCVLGLLGRNWLSFFSDFWHPIHVYVQKLTVGQKRVFLSHRIVQTVSITVLMCQPLSLEWSPCMYFLAAGQHNLFCCSAEYIWYSTLGIGGMWDPLLEKWNPNGITSPALLNSPPSQLFQGPTAVNRPALHKHFYLKPHVTVGGTGAMLMSQRCMHLTMPGWCSLVRN